MSERIPYTKPSITEREVHYAVDAAQNGWGDKCYDYINLFESKFKDYIGVKHAIATSSCTGAMHMGLAALGIRPGDEVILANTNWIATAAPIVHLGAKPIFVDILTDTWCLDPKEVEKVITSNTRAIVATHLYGNLCDLGPLMELSNHYNIPIIEDSAEAIGSTWRSKKAGSLGLFSTYSFHGTKTITTGEGGMFCTNDTQLFQKFLTLSNHGRSSTQKKQFWPDVVGYKYKMSNVQAAIGLAQIERIDELVERKREIFLKYRNALNQLPGVFMNPEHECTKNGYWMPTVVFDKRTAVTRSALQTAFSSQNIDARVFFWPLSSTGLFEHKPQTPNAFDIPERAINLPSFHDMSDTQQDRVINVIRSAYYKHP